MMKRLIILFFFQLCCLPVIHSQFGEILPDTQVYAFDLGEVQIIGKRSNPFTSVLRSKTLIINQLHDVSEALMLLPGLNFVHQGPRNEGMVSIRGFDLRQVPVLVDGVPVYVSYDGYTDLARFLVSDLAKISVTGGETSLLLGPNALGGAINLVTRKPASPFEMDLSTGMILDRSGWGGWHSDLNAGSRLKRFYFQAGASFLDRKPYILSRKYELASSRKTLTQDNSQHRDLRYSFKVGYTPNKTDSYVLSYHFQDGSKGVPVYKGEDPNQRRRYWQFPEVRKQGVHFNSKTALSENYLLQIRAFYDDYFSDLRSYDDSTYLTQERRSSFISIYNDETLGGSVIFSMKPVAAQEIKMALHTIYDHHRENNTHPAEESVRHFRDLTFSAGVEDYIRFNERLDLVLGAGVHSRDNLQADNYESSVDSVFPFTKHSDRAFNLLGGLQYRLGEKNRISLNTSRKSRFPTMKDRYSYRLGRSIPNPGLRSENSWNTVLGYALLPSSDLQLKTSLFYSRLQNTIQAVYGVDPDDSSVYQFQNTGKAVFFGWEFELAWKPLHNMETALQYTLTERRNLSTPAIKFTDVPPHKLHSHIRYRFLSRLDLQLAGTYNSPRISTSDGNYRTKSFFTMDLTATVRLFKGLIFESAVRNILDAGYSYMEGYPSPGRQYSMGLRYRLK